MPPCFPGPQAPGAARPPAAAAAQRQIQGYYTVRPRKKQERPVPAPAKSRSAAPFRAALLPYMMDVHFSRFSSRTTVSTFAVPGNMSTAAARTAS